MTASSRALDTTAEVETLLVERWRCMSPAERLAMVTTLNDDCLRMAEAGVRLRHPDAADDEVRLRVAAIRLGRDLSVEAYGWDPDLLGW